jgi:predicted lipoprotein with Yx(FWY)xxD motif
MNLLATLAPIVFLTFTACATVAADFAWSNKGVLTDSRGMTLYTFKKDSAHTSTCYDGCAKAWPPFIVPAGANVNGDFSMVLRKDGTQQWAYKSMPLYYYAGDSAPGETAGDGSGKVWFVVRGAAAGGVAPAPKVDGYYR